MAENGNLIEKGQAIVRVGSVKRAGEILAARSDKFAELLPRGVDPQRFSAVVLQAVRSTPKLQLCTQDSFMESAMRCASLGLEVAQGHAFLIPRKNRKKGVLEAHFQLGYQGKKELAYRSGEYALLEAHVVYERDEFRYQRGLSPDIVHVPSPEADRGPSTHYYAIAWPKDLNGRPIFEVMTLAEVEAIRQRSQSKDDGPWVTDFNEMGRKTVFGRLCKWLKLTPEARNAFALDAALEFGGDTSDVLSMGARDAVSEGLSAVAQTMEEEAEAEQGPTKLEVLEEHINGTPEPKPETDPDVLEARKKEKARQKAALKAKEKGETPSEAVESPSKDPEAEDAQGHQPQAESPSEPKETTDSDVFPITLHQGTADPFPLWVGDFPPIKKLPEVLARIQNPNSIARMWFDDSRNTAGAHYFNRLSEFPEVKDPEDLLTQFMDPAV